MFDTATTLLGFNSILVFLTPGCESLLTSQRAKRETRYESIRDCQEKHGFQPPEFLSQTDPKRMADLLNASCASFPGFLNFAKDAIVGQFKAMNPGNPVSMEQVDKVYHAICDDANQKGALCYFSPLQPHKKAEQTCYDQLRKSDEAREYENDECARRRAELDCALPILRRGCGGQKTADIMEAIYGAEIQTVRGCMTVRLPIYA